MAKTQVEETGKLTNSPKQKYGARFPLPSNPLESNDLGYLEKIINACEGFEFLNVIHHAHGYGGSIGMPSLTDADHMGKYLTGGKMIVARYSVEEIKTRYETLSKL